MRKEMKIMEFYFCEKCGNVIESINNKNTPICCGQQMKELIPNESENEKHTPRVEFNDDKILIKIGKVEHPMQNDHLIEWIQIRFDNVIVTKKFKPNEKPIFETRKLSEHFEILAYCNKHGLWIKRI